jgi:ketosteroid isomerase-like protein
MLPIFKFRRSALVPRSFLPALALISAVMLALPGTPGRAQKANAVNGSEGEIKAVLTEQKEAWNRGDVTGFMRGYWNSPELTCAGRDSFTRGWDTVLERYKRTYPDKAAMGQLDFTELEIRPLGPDAALVLGKWHLARTSRDVGGIFTLVFQRFSGGWKIVHDHTN